MNYGVKKILVIVAPIIFVFVVVLNLSAAELPEPIFDNFTDFSLKKKIIKPAASSRRLGDEKEKSEFKVQKEPARKKVRRKIKRSTPRLLVSSEFQKYREMLADGRNEEAAIDLYSLSKSRNISKKNKNEAKYLFGVSLMNLRLMQVASYQFISLIRGKNKRFLEPSIEKLQIIADLSSDDKLISYAFKNRVLQGPRDMRSFRQAQIKMQGKDYNSAVKLFSKIPSDSKYFYRARYNAALSLAKLRKENAALKIINSLLLEEELVAENDVAVNGELAKARILYQKKSWDDSINSYRSIPRSSIYWHDALFEQTWAFLMGAKFRSALSNLHSLHSPYYENVFQPESLILRSIVYLYICNYKEMDKVIKIFDGIYSPLKKELKRYLQQSRKKSDYFSDFNKQVNGESSSLPKILVSEIQKNGDVKRNFIVLANLIEEQSKLNSFSDNWKSSRISEYANKTINRKILAVEKNVGKKIKNILVKTYKNLKELNNQNALLKFEKINGIREKLKSKISGKSEKKTSNIDDEKKRDFYIQNGYEYWPFKSEYWLDEIGNYHFLGKTSCGQ